ncbi:tRNA pseudouridine(38-40) synthase TruA [Candidatus Fokinia crypta]|uniref:tRNA pseudouridine synthase A n=1 Tax=Candidatus Fokinia crypta TaxID=1920990 RepID=A0ABZ0UP64_9RICK|nr:tRNA pseudouridine(38-40) synthase TruA [Candidatus Fokinia cryptica]WPX97914.1 tRNA pseudouridine synthase A [Candidatus Fokinia cryptica]
MLYRYKVRLEYDGSRFIGWQKQPFHHGISVQQKLEEIFSTILHKNISLFVAGRTDSGVHALNQVAHFDTDILLESKKICTTFNHFLKDTGIVILDIENVERTFDARFSAKQRIYSYNILNRNAPTTLFHDKVWHIFNLELNIPAMKEATTIFIGTHDFTAFRSPKCQAKSPVKTIDYINISEPKFPLGKIINIEFGAKSFLHNQVRLLVGGLFCIGSGKWDIKKLATILEDKSRKECHVMAPSHGLYLKEIFY